MLSVLLFHIEIPNSHRMKTTKSVSLSKVLAKRIERLQNNSNSNSNSTKLIIDLKNIVEQIYGDTASDISRQIAIEANCKKRLRI